jgi:mannan endo-1,4-beta-mannosidase
MNTHSKQEETDRTESDSGQPSDGPSRRQVLATIGAGAGTGLAGCSGDGGSEVTDTATATGTPTATATQTETESAGGLARNENEADEFEYKFDGESQFDSFVETDGAGFVVDGEPVYFNGTNNYTLVDPNSSHAGTIDTRLKLYEELGINVVRTWAFCEGQGGRCYQPEAGEYNEAAFEHLDYLIAKAGQHGIRLVLSFTDYWDHYGGMPKYAEWAGLEKTSEFYTSDEAQQLYRDYVEYVLTRENTFTGREYRNEPAILAWELANEPRCKGISDNVSVFQTWVEETSAFIKGIDDNHLLSTGMEGFDNRPGGSSWRSNGSEGTDFVENHEVEDIDICSAHLYPQAWSISADEADSYLERRARLAEEKIGKPFYLGEFQWSIDGRKNDKSIESEKRNEVLSGWYDILDEHDADAATIWQLRHEDVTDTGGFAVWPSDETMEIIDDYTQKQKEKSEATS